MRIANVITKPIKGNVSLKWRTPSLEAVTLMGLCVKDVERFVCIYGWLKNIKKLIVNSSIIFQYSFLCFYAVFTFVTMTNTQ